MPEGLGHIRVFPSYQRVSVVSEGVSHFRGSICNQDVGLYNCINQKCDAASPHVPCLLLRGLFMLRHLFMDCS
jgi:hypothetical protein